MYKTKFTKGIHRLLMLLLCVSILSWPVENVQAIGKTTAAVSKRTKTTAELTIRKISGVTGYQVFLSNSRKGRYAQVGATRTASFKLSKLKKNKADGFRRIGYFPCKSGRRSRESSRGEGDNAGGKGCQGLL